MRISVGAIILFLSVGVWCGTRFQAKQPSANPTREIASVTVEPIVNDALAKEVQRESFYFKRKIDAKLNQKKKEKGRPRNFADVEYEGTFFVDWLTEKTSRRAAISFEIKNRGQTVKSSVPFVVEFVKDWVVQKVQSVSPQNETEEDMINVLKDFLAVYAFRTQEDTSGRFEARFDEKGSGKEKQIHYQKTRYLDSKIAQLEILESNHEVVLSKQQELVSIRGKERTQIAPSSHGSEIAIVTETSYELTRQKTLKVKQPKWDSTQLVQTSIQLEMHRPAFDAQKWSVMQSELNHIQKLSRSERLSLFHELLKTLKKEPARLKDFQDWVMSMKDQPGILNFGIGVLATLGTEASQKILVNWFNDLPESRHPILGALSTSEAKLSQDSKNLIAAVVDQKTKNADLAYNAAFAMGSEIRKDGEGNQAAEQKLSRLYEAAIQAHQSNEQMIYLDAMGNSGSTAFASVVERNLASTDESLREKSVYAARFMKTEVAQGLILKGLQDSSPKVRLSAVKAVAYQSDASPYRPLLERYSQDTNEVGAASRQVLSGLNQ